MTQEGTASIYPDFTDSFIISQDSNLYSNTEIISWLINSWLTANYLATILITNSLFKWDTEMLLPLGAQMGVFINFSVFYDSKLTDKKSYWNYLI